MAIYRNVQLSFWTDSKIVDDFTPEDKYFYLYLMTNPHTNLCGCYEISNKQMSDETGYSKETIVKLIDRLMNVHEVIDYDDVTKEVMLINWSKYNWINSIQFKKALEKEIAKIKSERLKDTVSIRYAYRMDTTVTVTVTDTVTDTVAESVKRKNNKYKKEDFNPIAKQIIDHLNKQTGKAFKYSKTSLEPIIARLEEGYTMSDCIKVIDIKVSEWGRDSKMNQYLAPDTLFRASKFPRYLNQKAKPRTSNPFLQMLEEEQSNEQN